VTVSRAALLPLLFVALALGKATGAWDLATAIAALLAAMAIVGPRWELDRGRQLVVSAMGASTGYTAVALLYDPQPGSLRDGWARVVAAALLSAGARLLIVRPRGGAMAITALAFAGMIAVGETRGGVYYALLAAAFLATSIWAIGKSERPSAGLEVPVQRVLVGAVIVSLAIAIGLGTTIGMRRLHTWIKIRGHSTAFVFKPRVGFSDRVDLGALDGLLDSDTIVLRVRGPRVDYLRGAVLDVYAAGQWVRSDPVEREVAATYDGETGADGAVEVSAVSDRTDRFFLPLGAKALVTSPSAVLVDAVGVVKRQAKHGANTAHFSRGERGRATPAPPGPFDTALPRRIRADLGLFAAAWSADASGPAEKLDAIERHLATEYRYARAFRRATGLDPALDFIMRDKSGHCEYFATALALVARAAGIPARLVTGYRVSEKSPFGYYVVRERNAHAWVEAFVPGKGWTVRDPTPEAYVAQNLEHTAGYAASALDALRLGYDEFTDWLGQRTVGQTAMAWVFGFFVLVWIVARGVKPRRVRPKAVPEDERPLTFLRELFLALARAGHRHRADEPIERLAARIPDPRAADLLERYAALRYGGIGDANALADEVARYIEQARQPGSASFSAASSRRTNP
jgi:protein-glutamine gamma-glutamyltransferase